MCEREPSRRSGDVDLVSLFSVFLETFQAGSSNQQTVCGVLLGLMCIAVVDFVQRRG